MKTKKIRQYSLPHDHKYMLVDVCKGSMEGNATVCDNCGAIISNIAHIKTPENKHFYVGMDCAETLTSLKDNEDFEMAKMNMREANKILAAKNKHLEFKLNDLTDMGQGMQVATFTWKEKKKTKRGLEYVKETGSGLVFNNTLSLFPEKFKQEYGITAKWVN